MHKFDEITGWLEAVNARTTCTMHHMAQQVLCHGSYDKAKYFFLCCYLNGRSLIYLVFMFHIDLLYRNEEVTSH